jgi:hypothetical protein
MGKTQNPAVGEIDTYDLAVQVAWLMDLPHGIRHLAVPRLTLVMAELVERAQDVLGETAP